MNSNWLPVLLALALFSLAMNAQAKSFTVTAYCGCDRCCAEANQPTASGRMPVEGVTVAGPRKVPLGTWVYIEGVGKRRVDDRTARRFNGRWDVYFKDHKTAKAFGKKKLKVTIIK